MAALIVEGSRPKENASDVSGHVGSGCITFTDGTLDPSLF